MGEQSQEMERFLMTWFEHLDTDISEGNMNVLLTNHYMSFFLF